MDAYQRGVASVGCGSRLDPPPCTSPSEAPPQLTTASQFKLALSPTGTNLDTHRTWETLSVGGVPLVDAGTPLEEAYTGLPVLRIHDWAAEVTLAGLTRRFLELHGGDPGAGDAVASLDAGSAGKQHHPPLECRVLEALAPGARSPKFQLTAAATAVQPPPCESCSVERARKVSLPIEAHHVHPHTHIPGDFDRIYYMFWYSRIRCAAGDRYATEAGLCRAIDHRLGEWPP